MKLKAITLNKLKPGFHGDGGGLYLQVRGPESKSWVLRIVVRGKRRDIGLGSLADVSLEKARVKASALRARARNGEDIVTEREIEKNAQTIPTFEHVAKIVHEGLSKTFSSETHAYNWMQSLETYVFPTLGKRTVDTIDSADIITVIGPMWNTVPDTAGRTLRRIKAVFDYCMVKGYRTVMVNGLPVTKPNPCDAIRTALPKRNKKATPHESLPYGDLPAFIQRLRTCRSALSVKLCLEFTILTCARAGEALNAKWEEFDMEQRVWTVPAERMKMKIEHKVPLSQRCIEILELAKQFNDGAIVFPGRYQGHPLSNMSLLMPLRRMGYEDLTVHGFRASFKTWAEETTKFDSLVIEASMAHAVKGIERHYLRTTFIAQRSKLMDAWARFATNTPASRVVGM